MTTIINNPLNQHFVMFNKKQEEEHNIWMSFSDLFSGFMVIFIVVSLMLFNQDPVKGKYSEMTKEFKDKLPK